MLSFEEIDKLVEAAHYPLKDKWLETLNAREPDAANYRRFLYSLVKVLKPKVSLELGVYSGRTLAHLCAASAEYGGHVIGLDLCTSKPVNDLSQKYDGLLHFREGDTTHIKTFLWVLDLVREHGPIGVIYQDSSHHFWASWHEWDHYLHCLDDFAVWLSDDITDAFHSPVLDPPKRGMPSFFEGLPGEKRLYKDKLHKGNTQGIVLVNGEIRDQWDGWYARRRRLQMLAEQQ